MGRLLENRQNNNAGTGQVTVSGPLGSLLWM